MSLIAIHYLLAIINRLMMTQTLVFISFDKSLRTYICFNNARQAIVNYRHN